MLPITCNSACDAARLASPKYAPCNRSNGASNNPTDTAATPPPKHRKHGRRTGQIDQHGEPIRAGTEEADITERQVAGEPVCQVQPLCQHQEHDEVQ